MVCADVPDIAVVINYDLPNVAEDYIHRIGRTGRRGRKGTAVTLLSPLDSTEGTAAAQLASALVTLLSQASLNVPLALLRLAASTSV